MNTGLKYRGFDISINSSGGITVNGIGYASIKKAHDFIDVLLDSEKPESYIIQDEIIRYNKALDKKEKYKKSVQNIFKWLQQKKHPMYIKVKELTATQRSLSQLLVKVEKANKAAKKMLKEFGSDPKKYYSNGKYLAGGIVAIYFSDKPEGFKHVGDKWQNIFMPLASNKGAWQKINSLPVIKAEELNEIIGFAGPQAISNGGVLTWVKAPQVIIGKEVSVINILPNTKFELNEDMEEITETEFLSIKEKINSSKK